MNKNNMFILSNYLMSNVDRLSEHFDMKRFLKHDGKAFYNNSGPTQEQLNQAMTEPHVCNTSACAVGFAPSVIPVAAIDFNSLGQLNYLLYSQRVFMESHLPEWNYCFSGCWDDVDNTIQGAAFRLWLVASNADENGYVDKATGDLLEALLEIPDSCPDVDYYEIVNDYETRRDNWVSTFTPAEVN